MREQDRSTHTPRHAKIGPVERAFQAHQRRVADGGYVSELHEAQDLAAVATKAVEAFEAIEGPGVTDLKASIAAPLYYAAAQAGELVTQWHGSVPPKLAAFVAAGASTFPEGTVVGRQFASYNALELTDGATNGLADVARRLEQLAIVQNISVTATPDR